MNELSSFSPQMTFFTIRSVLSNTTNSCQTNNEINYSLNANRKHLLNKCIRVQYKRNRWNSYKCMCVRLLLPMPALSEWYCRQIGLIKLIACNLKAFSSYKVLCCFVLLSLFERKSILFHYLDVGLPGVAYPFVIANRYRTIFLKSFDVWNMHHTNWIYISKYIAVKHPLGGYVAVSYLPHGLDQPHSLI